MLNAKILAKFPLWAHVAGKPSEIIQNRFRAKYLGHFGAEHARPERSKSKFHFSDFCAWKQGRRPTVERGPGAWARSVGLERGPGAWAWSVGPERGPGAWAWSVGPERTVGRRPGFHAQNSFQTLSVTRSRPNLVRWLKTCFWMFPFSFETFHYWGTTPASMAFLPREAQGHEVDREYFSTPDRCQILYADAERGPQHKGIVPKCFVHFKKKIYLKKSIFLNGNKKYNQAKTENRKSPEKIKTNTGRK